jgi:hypothetical protein
VISLLPAHHETLVLPKPSVEVYHILESATSHKTFIQTEEQKLFFNGWVRETRFRLSLRQRRFNNYLPLVIGQIESTSTGCIVFIDYKLFPATRLFVTLWTILIVLGATVTWFQTSNLWFLPGGGLVLTIIHLIVWANFRLQLKPTLTTIHDLLT